MKVIKIFSIFLMFFAGGTIAKSIKNEAGVLLDGKCFYGPDTPLPDTFGPIPGPLPVDLVVDKLFELHGSVKSISIVKGLSTLRFQAGLRTVVDDSVTHATFAVTISNLTLDATYDAMGFLANIPLVPIKSGNFTGSGKVNISFENLNAKGGVSLALYESQLDYIAAINLTLGFDKLNLALENFIIDGEEVDWPRASATITQVFNSVLWPIIGPQITEAIKDLVNKLISATAVANKKNHLLSKEVMDDWNECNIEDFSPLPTTDSQATDSDVPTTETPTTEIQATDSDVPTTEIPTTESQATDSDVPTTEIPTTESQATDSDVPTTEIPTTESQATDSDVPTTEIPTTTNDDTSPDISTTESNTAYQSTLSLTLIKLTFIAIAVNKF